VLVLRLSLIERIAGVEIITVTLLFGWIFVEVYRLMIEAGRVLFERIGRRLYASRRRSLSGWLTGN
jgi:hypothetical protein